MNTEIQTSGKRFNWLTVLQALSDGAGITPTQRHNLSIKAGKWPTCACGQLCKELPKTHDGMPLDSTLIRLGGNFYQYVVDQQWCQALETFYEIEDRTADLLDERRLASKQAACVK